MSLAKKYLKAILKLEAENKELRRIIAQQAEIIAQQKATLRIEADGRWSIFITSPIRSPTLTLSPIFISF